MNFARRFILVIFVSVSCVGCDQMTKSIAMSILSETESWSYLADTVRLQLVYNHGAFLSLGSSLPEAWRYGVFTIGAGFLMLGALAYAFLSKPGSPLVVMAIALLFAGGVGNLFDRLAYGGLAVDFISVGIGPVRTGIFNVADIGITVGVFILFSAALHREQKKR